MELINILPITDILPQGVLISLDNLQHEKDFQNLLEKYWKFKNLDEELPNFNSTLKNHNPYIFYPLLFFQDPGNLNLNQLLANENLVLEDFSSTYGINHDSEFQDGKASCPFIIYHNRTEGGGADISPPGLIGIEDVINPSQIPYGSILLFDFSHRFKLQDGADGIFSLLKDAPAKTDSRETNIEIDQPLVMEWDGSFLISNPLPDIENGRILEGANKFFQIEAKNDVAYGKELLNDSDRIDLNLDLQKITQYIEAGRILKGSKQFFHSEVKSDVDPKVDVFNDLAPLNLNLDPKKIDQHLFGVERQENRLSFNLFSNPRDISSEGLFLSKFSEMDNHNHKDSLLEFKQYKSPQEIKIDIFSNHEACEFQNILNTKSQSKHMESASWSKIFDYKEIYQQIEKQVLWCLKNDREKIRLILNPPELGHIQIEVKNHQKNVEILLWTEHADTKQLLELNRDFLSGILSQDGFKLERFAIYFNQEMTAFQERHDHPVFKEKRIRENHQGEEEIDGVQEEGLVGSYHPKPLFLGVKHIDLKV